MTINILVIIFFIKMYPINYFDIISTDKNEFFFSIKVLFYRKHYYYIRSDINKIWWKIPNVFSQNQTTNLERL